VPGRRGYSGKVQEARGPFLASCTIRLVSAFLTALVFAALPSEGQEPAEGVIGGHPALAFWPAQTPDATRPLDPRGFTVHLIPDADQSIELTKPAGEWFLLDAPGFYRTFLEGPGLISRELGLVMWGLGHGGLGLKMLSPVIEAGRVIVDARSPVGPDRLMTLYSVTQPFFRNTRGPAADVTVQMPPGPVLALLGETGSGTWVAMSRMVEARSDGTGVITFRRPAEATADLFVRVAVHGVRLDECTDGISVALDTGGACTEAALLFHDRRTIYAAWWSLPAGPAVVRVACPGVRGVEKATVLPGAELQALGLETGPPPR